MVSSVELIKYEANLLNLSNDLLIQPHLNTAELKVKSIIGNKRYSEIADMDQNSFEYKILQKSETYLAISFLLVSVNINYSGGGLIIINQEDTRTQQYLSGSEINSLHSHFFEIGIKFAELLKHNQNLKTVGNNLINFFSVSTKE